MTWQLPDTYHLAGHGRGTATLKFYEGRDILWNSPQASKRRQGLYEHILLTGRIRDRPQGDRLRRRDQLAYLIRGAVSQLLPPLTSAAGQQEDPKIRTARTTGSGRKPGSSRTATAPLLHACPVSSAPRPAAGRHTGRRRWPRCAARPGRRARPTDRPAARRRASSSQAKHNVVKRRHSVPQSISTISVDARLYPSTGGLVSQGSGI